MMAQMRFELTDEQKLVRQSTREFAENELAPIAREIDASHRYPEETVEKMAELGMMGVTVPEEYGGSPIDSVSIAIMDEELARCCASTATIHGAVASLAVPPIVRFGTEEQKERYLPNFASGQWMGAFALSEPNAGSDPSALATTATLEGDEWVLNGTKNFITCGSVADLLVVFATQDRSKGYRGISAFLVEKDAPGFEVLKLEEKLGIKASPTASLGFTDCRIPRENLLGEEGRGLRVALNTIDSSRIAIAAMAVGIGQGCLDESIKYARERRAFGKSIAEFQAIQWKLADMAVEIEAARMLTYRAAQKKDRGEKHTLEGAMAKMYASEAASRATEEAVQIHGGYGYIKDYPVERMFRDIKVFEIFEGTNQIQRMVIARELLQT
jgi:butyryl-CoA dehydrogenase